MPRPGIHSLLFHLLVVFCLLKIRKSGIILVDFMIKKDLNNKVVIYQAKSGAIELKGDFQHETIWATQAEMAEIFNVTPQNITLHLKNIFKDKELYKDSTCKEYLQVQKEGNREIRRRVTLYNLDAIIAVGYRINSVVGTNFRQWATKTLRAHILDGFTINRKRIAQNYSQFIKAVEQVKSLLPAGSKISQTDVLDLIKLFANTWLSLSAYDQSGWPKNGATKKQAKLTADHLWQAVNDLKRELVAKKLATKIFAQENAAGNLAGIVGNVMQAFGKKDVYPTLEEKAAHLLYFMVKNHPFVDGNKRSGALAFVWFLKKYGLLNTTELTPSALTALTLLIAESDPKDKDKMIGVVLMLLKK